MLQCFRLHKKKQAKASPRVDPVGNISCDDILRRQSSEHEEIPRARSASMPTRKPSKRPQSEMFTQYYHIQMKNLSEFERVKLLLQEYTLAFLARTNPGSVDTFVLKEDCDHRLACCALNEEGYLDQYEEYSEHYKATMIILKSANTPVEKIAAGVFCVEPTWQTEPMPTEVMIDVTQYDAALRQVAEHPESDTLLTPSLKP